MARTTGSSHAKLAALRSEIPCTVAVLVGDEDFAAMRAHSTFRFDDYADYLRHTEELLRALRSRGMHVRVAVFDPREFTAFCATEGLAPDTPVARARYASEAAADGAAVHYQGEPLHEVVQAALHGAERRATWEFADGVLAESDTGRTMFTRMTRTLVRLLENTGPGLHHLVCSTVVHGTPLVAVLHAEGGGLPEEDTMLFCTVLAAGAATGAPGGVVLRTRYPAGQDTVRAWALRAGHLEPLREAEVFNAYCTDHRTGDPVAPEPGVEYRSGYSLRERPHGV